MVKLYIIGMVPGDSYTFEALRNINERLKPKIISVEETQDDINVLMSPAYTEEYVVGREEYLKENPDANDKTFKDLLADEICFYKQLNRYGFDGIKIVGLDDADFDSSGFEDAEGVYLKRKREHLSRILSLNPEKSEALVQAEYDAVGNGNVLIEQRPSYFVVSDSEPLTEYYEVRDKDTAERLERLVISERCKKGFRNTAIVYLCNISHLDDRYQNLRNKIGDLNIGKPKIMLMRDFLRFI